MRMLRKMASSRFGITNSNSDKNDSDEQAGGGGGGASFGIGNKKAEGSVKKSKGWNVMRSDVALISRNDLEESVSVGIPFSLIYPAVSLSRVAVLVLSIFLIAFAPIHLLTQNTNTHARTHTHMLYTHINSCEETWKTPPWQL